MRSRLVSLFALGPLLARRRARRDLPLVIVWAVLVLLTLLVAVAAPRYISQSVDAGARAAVSDAGLTSDLLGSVDVGAERSDRGRSVPPADIGDVGDDIIANLPSAVLATYATTTYSAVGPHTSLELPSGTPIDLSIALLVDPSALTVVDGTLPADTPPTDAGPYPIAISAAAASATGLAVGSMFSIPLDDNGTPMPVTAQVVAIVEAVDRDDPLWADLPGLFDAPVHEQREGEVVTVIPLATPAVVNAVSAIYSEAFDGTIRYHLDPDRFTGDLLQRVSNQMKALDTNSAAVTGSVAYDVSITTRFPEALEPFGAQRRAAEALFSMILAGVLGVAGCVLVLMSRLLVMRRALEYRLERARGASVVSIVLRTVPQAVLVSALAVAVALIIVPPPIAYPGFFVAVLAIAVLADPVQSLIAVVATRTARRAPANRVDRSTIILRQRMRRIAIELTVIALATAAFVAIMGRGLLQTATTGIDPLLAAAPLLVAAALTVVIVRLYPLPVRAAAGLAARSAGLHGLIASARARGAVAVLPLLALSLAVGLTTANAALTDTVAAGQDSAAWQAVGADARIDTAITDEQRATLQSADGVKIVSSVGVLRSSRVELGNGTGIVTVVAVDDHYGAVLDALPNIGDTVSLEKLRQPSTDVPVLLDSRAAELAISQRIVLSVDQENVRLRVVGTFDAPVTGDVHSPLIYVPIDALNAQLKQPVVADSTLVVGPGAAAAVAAVAGEDSTSRVGWLADQRELPLVAGVQGSIALSVGLLVLLAGIALIATLVAGTRNRGTTLSLLRTLGASGRFGWWLALADLAPLVIAAVVGGLASGLLIARLLFRSLGLNSLTGSPFLPVVFVSPASTVSIIAGAAALLALAVLVEVVNNRRMRLNEVLRVGETV